MVGADSTRGIGWTGERGIVDSPGPAADIPVGSNRPLERREVEDNVLLALGIPPAPVAPVPGPLAWVDEHAFPCLQVLLQHLRRNLP